MKEIKLDDNNILTYRLTPWDARVFGFNTIEILTIQYKNIENIELLLNEFDKICSQENIKFAYTRINSQDKLLRHALTQNNYYYAETSFYLTKNDIQKEDFSKNFRNELILTEPTEEDFEIIKSIAKNDFNYSRFHEDNNIKIEDARNRYFYWIDDMRKQNKKFLVYKINNEVISFLGYNLEDETTVDLILAGSEADKGFISLSFWASFMNYFKHSGITKSHTVISASNIGIINLYNKLNFKYEQTMIGYHKFF